MKNKPPLRLDELKCAEQKDLVRFLKRRGYDQIFRLNRAFVVLKHSEIKLHDYKHDALNVILFEDPSMAERPPSVVWESRSEVYITGNKFGLRDIVTTTFDTLNRAPFETRVVTDKSPEDWRKEAEYWPRHWLPDGLGRLPPKSKEKRRILKHFEAFTTELGEFLKKYDTLVAETERALQAYGRKQAASLEEEINKHLINTPHLDITSVNLGTCNRIISYLAEHPNQRLFVILYPTGQGSFQGYKFRERATFNVGNTVPGSGRVAASYDKTYFIRQREERISNLPLLRDAIIARHKKRT